MPILFNYIVGKFAYIEVRCHFVPMKAHACDILVFTGNLPCMTIASYMHQMGNLYAPVIARRPSGILTRVLQVCGPFIVLKKKFWGQVVGRIKYENQLFFIYSVSGSRLW